MTGIIVVKEKGRVLFANEELADGKRFMRVCRVLSDGTTREDLHQVDDIGPLLFIQGLGDIDDIAIRDIVQEAKANPPPPREDKPDITKLYLDFQEARRVEMSGRRHYGMWPRKKVR